jgi:hypothetical protein
MRKTATVVQKEVTKLSKEEDHSGELVFEGESVMTGENTQYQSQKNIGAVQSKILSRSKAPYNPVKELEEARFKRVDELKKNQRDLIES